MFKVISTISLLLVINTCLMSQAGFDFYPKMLPKELSKVNGKDIELKELAMKPELKRGIFLGKYFTVADFTSLSLVKYVYVGRVNTCRTGGCSIARVQDQEKESEFFDYFIFFDSKGTVQQVKIYNYQSTHGQEVTSNSWLRQFKNYNGKAELIAGNNVDAISGATISVDATIFDIEHKTNLLKKLILN